jgi:WD40 repeat protein
VANCYYIAALSAVAWATPYHIQHLTRAIGPGQDQFNNLVRFYVPDSSGALDKEIEVTDTVPLSGSGSFIYCRSSETGEIWPAIYEKAFAKPKTGTSSDHPDVTATAWGDCVYATAQLNGRQRHYYDTASRSGDQLWDIVRANSLSKRTFNPMTAWTYSSGDAAPKKVVYADGNIVGSHCYTVLGWDYRDGAKYLILRNPWGNTEASVGTLTGTTFLYDISWWRPINLAAVDGTFGMEANAFKTYFAGLGVAK